MYKKTKLLLMILLLISITITGCTKGSMYESHQDGYKAIKAIPGITFDIPESAIGIATAITSISNDMVFENNNTYLYKNGQSEYLLFNMSSIAVVVEKGTSFQFEESSEKVQALENNSIMGMFLEKEDKKLAYEESTSPNKLMATVKAQVTITDNIYGDFVGKMATISDNGEEYSIFIGGIAPTYKELPSDTRKTIDHVVKSMKLEKIMEETEENAVVIGGKQEMISSEPDSQPIKKEPIPEKKEETSVSEVETEIASEVTSEQDLIVVKEETSTLNMEESSIDIKEEDTKEEVKSEEKEVKEPRSPVEESVSSVSSTESATVEKKTEPTSIEKENNNKQENISTEKKKTVPVTRSNQKKKEVKKGESALSSIYDMLAISDSGSLKTRNFTSKEIEEPIITLDKIIKGKDAISLIKKATTNEDVAYDYFAAPEGSSWQVAEYSLDFSNCTSDVFVDVKLVGLDGEKLRFRGIPYSKRTYSLNSLSKKDGTLVTKLYCYYAVPNGCKEYALECGDGGIDSKEKELIPAYFYIQN